MNKLMDEIDTLRAYLKALVFLARMSVALDIKDPDCIAGLRRLGIRARDLRYRLKFWSPL